MTTVADMKTELTTTDVVELAGHIEKLAVATFLTRTRVVEATVREWLIEHHRGTETTRTDMDEAVRRYLQGRWDLR